MDLAAAAKRRSAGCGFGQTSCERQPRKRNGNWRPGRRRRWGKKTPLPNGSHEPCFPPLLWGAGQLICDVEITLVTPVSSVETLAYLLLDGELNVDVTDFQRNLVLYPCIHFCGLQLVKVSICMSKHCKGVVEETTTVALKLKAKN